MQEIRCIECNKLLLKAVIPYTVEIKCPKCKTVQTHGKIEFIDLGKSPIEEILPKQIWINKLNTNKESVENDVR